MNTNDPVRIMQVVAQAGHGGGETYLVQLARHLDPKRFALSFVFTEHGPLEDEIDRMGFPTFYVSLSGLIQPFAILKLAKVFKSYDADIVQSHGLRANFYVRLAARLAGVSRVISTVHASLEAYPIPHWRKAIYSWLDRACAGLSQYILCVSEALRQENLQRTGLHEKAVITIPNGVDTSRFDPSRLCGEAIRKELGVSDSYVIGGIGRLTPEKDFANLLRAVASFRSTSQKKVALILVGSGPERDSLEHLSKNLGIVKECLFLESRPDIPQILSALDILVIPSFSEGLPYILLEGLSMARPVIATSVGGIPEVVQNRTQGILVPPRDPEGIAQALSEIQRDPVQAEVMGKNGRNRVESEFGLDQMLTKTQSIYTTLLKRGSGLGKAEIGTRGKLHSDRDPVFLITADFFPMSGGQARYLWEIWTRLPADQIRILAPKTAKPASCSVPVERVRVPLGTGWASRMFKIILLSVTALRICLRERPRLVCSGQATGGGLVAWMLYRLFHIPFVLMLHGGDLLGWPASNKLLKKMLNHARLIITNSTFSKDLASSSIGHDPAQKIRVIHPPLPSDYFGQFPERQYARKLLSLPESEPVLLTTARLVNRKGVGDVLKILPNLIKRYPDLIYVVVGEGPEKERLQQTVLQNGIPIDQVRFEGFVSQKRIPLYYSASDLFVLVSRANTSDAEGFGIVYLEAQAAGLPVVAATGGGAPEAIRNQETGMLVNEDDSEALQRAIVELLENKEKRIAMGRQGQTWVREAFDPAKQANTFWNLLDGLGEKNVTG